ncbi:MAG: DPP IV N-terminal domain-containing protein, partial [Bacteroidetes bacterium]|nr:DPP IV N-terminal domain-containing protein [Bacteroidota bacterium]
MKKTYLFFATGLFISISFLAQTKLLTIQDAVLKGRSSLAPKRIQTLFVPETDWAAYIDNNALKSVQQSSGNAKDIITLSELNKNLKAASQDTLSYLNGISFKTADEIYITNKKGDWIYSLSKKTLAPSDIKKVDNTIDDLDEFKKGETYAYVAANNLFVVKNGKTEQVSKDGSYNLVYGKSVHRDEFGISKGTFWSPKGNLLAFYRMDQSDVTDYPIIDWSTYPAKNTNIKYPMAGNNSHYVTVGIYNVEKKSTVYLRTEGPKDQYLTNIAWSPDEKNIYVVVLNREQNHFKVNEYDAATGNFTRMLFEERDEKYAEPLHAMLFVKNNATQFIWQSRRDGFNHLYLYNIKGEMMKQLTKGNWEVKDVAGFDNKGENFFFHANEQSPVNQDFYSVNLKSGKMTRITSDNGFHVATLS